MTKICLVNDDGPKSTGLQELADTISENYEVAVVIPNKQRSATSKSLSLDIPLRIEQEEHESIKEFYTHSGTPADSVLIAHALIKDITLFVSGINPGANLGYQSIMTSGTVGAVLEAAFLGYPAIATSEVVVPREWFASGNNNRDYSIVCQRILDIIDLILKKSLPRNIDAVSMNFPQTVTEESAFVVTRPTRIRMKNFLDVRTDPNDRQYYWIRGQETDPTNDSDAYEVLNKGNISLSPIIIDSVRDDDLERLREFIKT